MKKKYTNYILIFGVILFVALAVGFYTRHIEGPAQDNLAPSAGEAEAAEALAADADAAEKIDEIAVQRQKAMSLNSQNMPDEALAVLEELKRGYPDNVNIDLDRMLIYYQNKRYSDAARVASEIDFTNVNEFGLSLAADSFLRSGNANYAESIYRKALERFPHDASFTVGLALTLATEKRFAEAQLIIKHFQTTSPAGADARLEETLAYVIAEEQKALSQPKADPQKTTAEELAENQAKYNEATVLVNNKQYAEAALILQVLYQKMPENQDLAYDYLATLSWSGQYLAAANLAKKVDLTRAPYYVLVASAASLREAGDLKNAEAAYRQALYRNPGDNTIIGGLATTLAQMGRTEEAKKLADVYAGGQGSTSMEAKPKELIAPSEPELIWSAHEVNIDTVEQFREEAVLLARENKYEMALAMLKALNKKFPENKNVFYDYVSTLTWAGKYEEAATLSNHFIGHSVPAYVLLAAATAQRQVKNYFMAETLYLEGQLRFPENSDFVAGQAMSMTDAGRFHEAKKVMTDYQAVAVGDNSPQIKLALDYITEAEHNDYVRKVTASRERAVMLGREGRYDEALYALAKLISVDPNDLLLQYDFLTILSWAGRHTEVAELAADTNLSQAPAYTLAAVANSYQETGRLELAEVIYRNSLTQDPYNLQMAEGLMHTLNKQGRFAEANLVIDNYKLTLQKDPKAAEASDGADKNGTERLAKTEQEIINDQRETAVKLAREGKYNSAVAALSQLHQRNPEDKDVLYDFITVLSWAGEFNAASELTAIMNINEAPDYALLAASSSLRKSGRLPQSYQLYTKGNSRFPDNIDFIIGQSMVLVDLGEQEKARTLLNVRITERPEEAEGLAEALAYTKSNGRKKIQSSSNVAGDGSSTGASSSGGGGSSTGARSSGGGGSSTSANSSAGGGGSFVPSRSQTSWRAQQDQAVHMAREGQFDEALRILAQLRTQYPQDQSLLGDYIVILNWAKQNETASTLVPALNLAQSPMYVISSASQAIEAFQGPEANRIFLYTVVQKQPNNAELLMMIAQLEAKAGNLAQAMDYVHQAEKFKNPALTNQVAEAKMAITYAQLARPDALGSRAVSLVNVGPAMATKTTPFKGGQMSEGANPFILSTENNFKSWSDWLHWSDEYKARRIRQTESLLVLEQLEMVPECLASADCQNRVKEAKIKILYDLNRPAEAISEYEVLKSRNAQLEQVSLFSVAGAYLADKRPLEARGLYTEIALRAEQQPVTVAQQQNDLYEAGKGLFWSYLDNENLPSALAQAQNNYRYVASLQGTGLSIDDWKVKDAALSKGLAYYYTGFYGYAEKYFRKMVKNNPSDSSALSNLAAVLTSRGLPRTALTVVKDAQTYNPDSVNLQVQEANIYLSFREWRKAHEILINLEQYAEFNNGIKQLIRRWETHNLFEARASVNWVTDTEGENPGTDYYASEPSLNFLVYSPPINYDWRVYAGLSWAGGEFKEGRAQQFVTLGGLEYRIPELEASLEVRKDKVRGSEFGVGLYGVYMPTDNWYFPFSLEKGSRNAPLRARNVKVTADAASIGAKYYWNESAMVGVNLGYMKFSDGNKRLTLGLNTTQRLWTWYDQYLDAWGGVYFSRNSKNDDRSYFNPKNDMAADVGLTWSTLLWRKGDKSLRQDFSVGIGQYKQEQASSVDKKTKSYKDTIWNLDYSHSWDITDRFSAAYGVGYGRRVYDGDAEKNINVHATIVWRF